MKDIELRRFLGAIESEEKWLGKTRENQPQNSWDIGTVDNPEGELMRIRKMAFEAVQKVRAISEYLELDFKDGDLNKGNFLIAYKKV